MIFSKPVRCLMNFVVAILLLSSSSLIWSQDGATPATPARELTRQEVEGLIAEGVTLETLAERGYNVKKLLSIGFSPGRLANLGVTVQQFLQAGRSIDDLVYVLPLQTFLAENINTQKLLAAGKKLKDLVEAGFSPKKIWQDGASLKKVAEYADMVTMLAEKIPVKDLLEAGLDEFELLNAGASLEDIAKYGDAARLRDRYSLRLLLDAGLTEAQILKATKASRNLDVFGIDSKTLAKIETLGIPKMRQALKDMNDRLGIGDDDVYSEKPKEERDQLLKNQFKAIRASGLKLHQVLPFFDENHLNGLIEARNEVLAAEKEAVKTQNAATLAAESNAVAAQAEENLAFGDEINGTLENFASLFNGFIDGVSSGNNNLSGVIDFKIPVEGMKFKAVISEPKLYDPIRMALGDDRSEEADSLESGLDDLDSDVTYTLSWAYNSEKIGRNAKYLETYLSKLMDKEGENPAVKKSTDDVQNILTDARAASEEDIPNHAPLIEWGMDRLAMLDLYNNFLVLDEAHKKSDLAWEGLKKRYHFDVLMELAANQPQLFISGSYRSADALIGPDNYSFSVNYEHGFWNLNKLRRKAPEMDLGKVSNFVLDNRRKIKRNPRLAFKAEYKRVRGYEFEMDGVSLMESDTYDWNLSLSYGLDLLEPKGLKTRGRLDFSLTREGSDNDMKVERTIITASYTRKLVGDNWSTPIALVYANKPEFLDGLVDDEITARIGFRYKQPLNNN